jgi:hypothetical protein
MVGQILDMVEAAPAATPYTFLGARLLETHSLSDYEKCDMLRKMEQMGGHKPSKLLANMMEFCPAGLEQPLPFHYLFTQRLPQALRTQLGEVEPGNPRARWQLERTNCGLLTPLLRPPSPLFQAQRQWRPAVGACAAVRGGGKATAAKVASIAEQPQHGQRQTTLGF